MADDDHGRAAGLERAQRRLERVDTFGIEMRIRLVQHLLRDGSKRGWSETAWSGAGSGCSTRDHKPKWQKDKGCDMRSIAAHVAWLRAHGYAGALGAWFLDVFLMDP